MRSVGLFMLACAAVLAAACRPVKTCVYDSDCYDWETRPGFCLRFEGMGPYCVVPTPTCPSMYRWAEFAGSDVHDRCVDPALIPKDAGTTDGGAAG